MFYFNVLNEDVSKKKKKTRKKPNQTNVSLLEVGVGNNFRKGSGLCMFKGVSVK